MSGAPLAAAERVYAEETRKSRFPGQPSQGEHSFEFNHTLHTTCSAWLFGLVYCRIPLRILRCENGTASFSFSFSVSSFSGSDSNCLLFNVMCVFRTGIFGRVSRRAETAVEDVGRVTGVILRRSGPFNQQPNGRANYFLKNI